MGVTTVKEDKDRLLIWFMCVVCLAAGVHTEGLNVQSPFYYRCWWPHWKQVQYMAVKWSLTSAERRSMCMSLKVLCGPKNSLKQPFFPHWVGKKRSLQGEKSSVCVVECVLAGNQCCVSINSIDIPVKRCVDSKDTRGPKISTNAAT